MMFCPCKDHIWPDKILSVPYKDLIQIKVYLAIYGLDLVLVYIKVISAQFFIWARYKSHICLRYGPDIKSISGPYMEFHIWPISGFRVRAHTPPPGQQSTNGQIRGGPSFCFSKLGSYACIAENMILRRSMHCMQCDVYWAT